MRAQRNRWLLIAALGVAVWVCLGALLAVRALQPLWLTRLYAADLRPSVERYLEVDGTIEGWRSPSAMAQVATGKRLADLIPFQCTDCPSVQVATRVQVPSLEVLEYSFASAKVRARVEWGWHKVSTQDGTFLGPCHAQAYTQIFLLAREADLWKVADIADIDMVEADRITDSPELMVKYCS